MSDFTYLVLVAFVTALVSFGLGALVFWKLGIFAAWDRLEGELAKNGKPLETRSTIEEITLLEEVIEVRPRQLTQYTGDYDIYNTKERYVVNSLPIDTSITLPRVVELLAAKYMSERQKFSRVPDVHTSGSWLLSHRGPNET